MNAKEEAERSLCDAKLDVVAAERASAGVVSALAAKREEVRAAKGELDVLTLHLGGLRGAINAASADVREKQATLARIRGDLYGFYASLRESIEGIGRTPVN